MLCCGANSDVTRRRRVDYWIYIALIASLFVISRGQDVGVESFTITNPNTLESTLCSAQQQYTFDIKVCEISGVAATVTELKVYYTNNENFEDATASTDGVAATMGETATTIDVDADGDATNTGAEVELALEAECAAKYTHICVVTTTTGDTYTTNDDACIALEGGIESTSNCPPEDCADPGELENGQRDSEDFSHRAEVKYSCNEGYTLSGVDTLSCYDGSWDNTVPICVEDDLSDDPDLASGLLTIISPVDAISCTDTPTVKFDLHVCDVGGDGGTITDVEFYYMDSDTFDAGTSKRSSLHSTGLTKEIAVDGDHTFSDQEVELTDGDNCEDYSYLCAFIVVTDDTDNENDYSCIKLDLSEISTYNCPDVSAEEFKVTSPDPEEISYTPEENTDIEFEIKAGAKIEDGTISGVEIYFTDNEDFYADDVIKSEKFEATEVDPKAITEDNDVEVKGKASVKPDEEQCAVYTHMCGKLIVSSTDTITDNNVQCIPTDEENAGVIDCGDSAAAVVGVGKYSVLASVIFVLASYLF